MPLVVGSQNDLYQVRLDWLLEGQKCKNVLHFQLVSGAGDPDVETHLILVLLACIVDSLLPGLSNSLTLESITWKQVSPVLGIEHVTVPTTPAVGENIKTALPTFCAAVLSIHTIVGGRSHRGRMYIPGAVAADDNQDFIDATDPFWTALVNFALCLVANFIPGDPPGSNSWAMGVYSRKLGGASFPYGAGFTAMADVQPQRALGTMRSRKFGRGV